MPENEKETDKAVSNSDINAECAYTSRLPTYYAFDTLHTLTTATYQFFIRSFFLIIFRNNLMFKILFLKINRFFYLIT